jgi:2-dehydro-3-deoxygluconokinase
MKITAGYYVTLGEIMLRLNSPGHERLLQQPFLKAQFGGGEANVAISLANFGESTRFVTALPSNQIGDKVMQYLAGFHVDTSAIIRKNDRLGIYFLEIGSGPRPSKVIYDRAYSAISKAQADEFNWDEVFENAHWFHITGITPALSATAAELSLHAVKEAKKRNITVSCDLNFRKKLWNYGKTAPDIMKKLLPYIDVVIANEEDIQKSLGMALDQQIGGVTLAKEKYKTLIARVVKTYPHLSHIGITLRESFSATRNDWSAILYSKKEDQIFESSKYHLNNIVDRVGGGDSFGAGLIYGLNHMENSQDAVNFAVAASALKHTIPGDVNLVSVQEVKELMQGEGHGRVQR